MAIKQFENAPLSSLLGDRAVVEELQNNIPILQELLGDGEVESTVVKGADGLKLQPRGEGSLEQLLEGRESTPGVFSSVEAVVLATGRPALLITDGAWETPRLDTVTERLAPAVQHLKNVIPRVGRLELINDPTMEYVGTGWMIDEDVMITNRHVANIFAYNAGERIVLRSNPFGSRVGVQVDFNEEYRSTNPPYEVGVADIVHIEAEGPGHPDMALVRLKQVAGLPIPQPIGLSPRKVERGDDVAVIGFPAKDGGRNDPFVMNRLFKNIYNVKRLSPGKITGVREDRFILTHDCTTLGGNSGSVVINLADGLAAGLHFAGSYKENNFAVTSETIRARLSELPSRKKISIPNIFTQEKKSTRSELELRKGYDHDFLGQPVALPQVESEIMAPVAGRDDGMLHYLHFSLAMHKKRRLALYTACNIDGARLYKIPRRRDRWSLDPRLDESYQVGNELYKHNPLDRGHLVRRLDPAWGESREEAAQAAADTFFYTNAHPQHAQLNQRSWLDLEEYILENAKVHDLRISVFTGPVFGPCDIEYRQLLIPKEYWKVVACINTFTGKLSATGYMLSQSHLIDDLEFVFGGFRTYQVPIQLLESKTGLYFGQLNQHDPMGVNELRGQQEINGPRDITL